MTAIQQLRHSQVLVWLLVFVLAILIVLAVLVRIAAAPGEPREEPVAAYIVSPSSGTFVAGRYRGAEPYVRVGSGLEPGTIVGNVEVWGKLQPVHSMVRGTVVEILVFDDAMIVTRQPLFKIQLEVEPTPS